MTANDYKLIKMLSTETLQELIEAIYDYDCKPCDCQHCALSMGGRCVLAHLTRDKEVDVL